MPYWQNSYSMQSSVSKESYAFIFPSMMQADFWMRQTSLKLHPEILFRDRFRHRLEFEDSTFYFFSSQLSSDDLKRLHINYVYSGDAIYIILDDIERLRINEDDFDANDALTDHK